MAGTNIREISMETLVEILEHGQFSHIYLKAVLDKYGYLEKNERAFINRLVNGTIERKLELDYIIDNYSKTKVKKMKPLIRTIMRMAVFEIYYMDAVPDSATCNEYVKLAKKRGFSGLSGFVNGVLRTVARQKGKLTYDDLSIKYSMPQWIVDKWTADYGVELTEEQNTAISDAAAQFMADNSAETIEEMGATEEYVNQYLEYRTYYSLVSDAAKESLDADISDDDCWMRTFTYVVFDTTGTTSDDGTLVEYTEDEIADIKAQAEELAAAEDFDSEVESLSLTAQTYSYLKGEEEDDTMDMTIIDEAEALSEGQTSSVIEIDGIGYYVIRLDADHASQTKRESLQTEAFDTLMETWKGEIVWTVNERAWSKVKFDALFKAPDEETTEEETTEEVTEESTETEDVESTEEDSEDTSDTETIDESEDVADDTEAEDESTELTEEAE